MPNSDAPDLMQAPLSQDAGVHDAAVRDYFVNCGLPEKQILDVKTFTGVSAVGRADEQLDRSKLRLEFYISNLTRQTPSGVPLPDSYASARINATGDVVKETVFWPDVDATVVTQAEALRAVVADSLAKASFLAKLPIEYAALAHDGRVAIHHTPGGWTGAAVAVAVYDVDYAPGHYTLHFGADGTQIRLPHENSEKAVQ